jgi:hypothetical protein
VGVSRRRLAERALAGRRGLTYADPPHAPISQDTSVISLNTRQLEAASSARFERELIATIAGGREEVRRTLASPEGLAQLREQHKRANAYGLTSELEVARYVITAWLLGADFNERFPAMKEVLETQALSPAQKGDALERIASTLLGELAGAT